MAPCRSDFDERYFRTGISYGHHVMITTRNNELRFNFQFVLYTRALCEKEDDIISVDLV